MRGPQVLAPVYHDSDYQRQADGRVEGAGRGKSDQIDQAADSLDQVEREVARSADGKAMYWTSVTDLMPASLM